MSKAVQNLGAHEQLKHIKSLQLVRAEAGLEGGLCTDWPSGIPCSASAEPPVVSLSRKGLQQVARVDNVTLGVLNKREEFPPIVGKGVHSNRTGKREEASGPQTPTAPRHC